MSKTHLVCVDGSEGSDAAFKYADAVFPKSDEFLIMAGRHQAYRIPGSIKAEQTLEHESQHAVMDHYKKMCEDAGRTCSFRDPPHRSVSHLAENICVIAAAPHLSGVIMGSRGLSPIQQKFMGSVSQAVINQCDKPVTIVKS